MALTKCWECGETVSDQAEICPHCGVKSPGGKPESSTEGQMQGLDLPADYVEGISDSKPEKDPPKKKSGCGKFILWTILIVVALAVFGGIIGGLQDAGILPTATPRPTSTPRPTPTITPIPTITPTPFPTPTWEELKESALELSYEDLFRYAEKHEGKLVYYRGKVVQVIESRGNFQLRVNVTSGEYGIWDDTIFLRYDDAPVRILEDDVVAFVGIMNGTITYESVLGGEVTIPDITVVTLVIEEE